ncbi:hypothetical protein [Vibrio splendidus]|uniref:hypothetical protein n=1 Tax=Vibrio splendidus TaxID=29497 RepID=UPI000808B668|nr:hypothetical protein [Vibrio splendidus]SBS64284.1 hypothetical protein VHE8714_02154 [Vibrio splendidus]
MSYNYRKEVVGLFALKCKSTKRKALHTKEKEVVYERTKNVLTNIKLLLSIGGGFVFSPFSFAEELSDTAASSPEIILDSRILAAIIVVSITAVIVPIIKHIYTERRKKKSFLLYFEAVIRDALATYGSQVDFTEAQKGTPDLETQDWVKRLQHAGLALPELLLGIHNGFVNANPGSYPIIQSAGITPKSLEHDMIVWSLNEQEVRLISAFLINQKQAQLSIQNLYEDPLYELIKSESEEKQTRWRRAGLHLVDDLTKMYIAAVQARTYLEDKGYNCAPEHKGC